MDVAALLNKERNVDSRTSSMLCNNASLNVLPAPSASHNLRVNTPIDALPNPSASHDPCAYEGSYENVPRLLAHRAFHETDVESLVALHSSQMERLKRESIIPVMLANLQSEKMTVWLSTTVRGPSKTYDTLENATIGSISRHIEYAASSITSAATQCAKGIFWGWMKQKQCEFDEERSKDVKVMDNWRFERTEEFSNWKLGLQKQLQHFKKGQERLKAEVSRKSKLLQETQRNFTSGEKTELLRGKAELTVTRDAMGEKIKCLEESYACLLSSHEPLESNLRSLQLSYTKLEREKAELFNALTAAQSNHGALQSSYDTLQSPYDTVQSTHSTLQSTHGALQSSHDALQSNYKSLLQTWRDTQIDRINVQMNMENEIELFGKGLEQAKPSCFPGINSQSSQMKPKEELQSSQSFQTKLEEELRSSQLSVRGLQRNMELVSIRTARGELPFAQGNWAATLKGIKEHLEAVQSALDSLWAQHDISPKRSAEFEAASTLIGGFRKGFEIKASHSLQRKRWPVRHPKTDST
ncbi:hypothetical protein GQ44DRAFT_768258 [Phaeosphaeriaceae sp. PMI808]|nr:hypothetical protein GQ44DRAFT_768258 [Phaeosphaeriaceae sp. PMI808]